MKRDPLIFLEHIIERIELIESFSKNLTKEKFTKDKLRQSALVRELEIIGEAVKNLPIEFTSQHPTIPWSKIAGFRDKLIHQYFGIDLDVVWDVIKKDIPGLKENILKIISRGQS